MKKLLFNIKVEYFWHKMLLGQKLENLLLKFVYRLPNKFLLYCFVIVAAWATQTEEFKNKTPSEISIVDCLKVWKK